MSQEPEDKNYLAMLTIPVILSMIFGFSGEVRARELLEKQITTEIEMRDSDENKTSDIVSEHEETKTGQRTRQSDLEQALIDKDFEKFLLLTKETPFGEIMTQAAFDELVEQYHLRKSGYRVSPFNYSGYFD